MTLPQAFLDRPLAHRALHDVRDGRPENSLVAIRAAVALGYGIELDVQISKDGKAMVFHDYDLQRLAGVTGALCQSTANELGATILIGSDEGIPTLRQVLDLVDGQVPLLIEIKDQDLRLGPNVGSLEEATARDLTDYHGAVAVMSFNPHSVAKLATLLPNTPRGLTTCNFDKEDWMLVPDNLRESLATIPDFDRTGSCFISHQQDQLSNPAVARLKSKGVPILCWTIRSPEQASAALQIADNVTFEGYLPT
ncbi:MAG: glycerophosphodiester phosphodiesterase family protein [Paracoccaceae bacterium]|jgi:glycerophosphoryl diester phosphodiesterase|nr:glycerophosphodiester phosphodiesterase family protein [Paracoccaceae bacterium]